MKIKKSELSKEAIIEFLHLGNIYFRRIFTDSIKKINAKEVLTFDPNGTVRKINKGLPSIKQTTSTSFHEFFNSLACSIKNERISVDITGGFDSRLIICMLADTGLDFDLGISGTDTSEDVLLAKEISSVLNKNCYITHHKIDNLIEEIPLMFIYNDGLSDVLAYHRVSQFQNERKERGITLAISGLGGELYKDF